MLGARQPDGRTYTMVNAKVIAQAKPEYTAAAGGWACADAAVGFLRCEMKRSRLSAAPSRGATDVALLGICLWAELRRRVRP
jgi:hypothetical protein